jgi:MFS family permease
MRRHQFAILCTHAVLFQATTSLLRPTASYRAIELGVDTALLGLLAASFALVPLLVALPAGDLADRYGESRVMMAGAAVIGVAALMYVFAADSFAMLLVATLVLGTGHLLCAVGQQSMVANLVAPGRFDSAFGYYTFAGSIGQVAGPGLLAVFGSSGALPRTDDAFRAASLVALSLVVVTCFVRRTPRLDRVAVAAERKVVNLLRTPGLTRCLVVSSVVLAAMDITLVYLPALGTETGLTVGVVSALLAVRAGATMMSRLFTGALTTWLGRRVLLVVSIGASGLATAVVPLPVPVWALFGAVVVMGFGLGVCQPATLAWLAELAPPGLQGRVMSLRLVGNRFGQVVLPSGLGLIAAGANAGGVLWLTAGTLVLAAASSRSVPMDSIGQEPDDVAS